MAGSASTPSAWARAPEIDPGSAGAGVAARENLAAVSLGCALLRSALNLCDSDWHRLSAVVFQSVGANLRVRHHASHLHRFHQNPWAFLYGFASGCLLPPLPQYCPSILSTPLEHPRIEPSLGREQRQVHALDASAEDRGFSYSSRSGLIEKIEVELAEKQVFPIYSLRGVGVRGKALQTLLIPNVERRTPYPSRFARHLLPKGEGRREG